jgi:hypothetical protein
MSSEDQNASPDARPPSAEGCTRPGAGASLSELTARVQASLALAENWAVSCHAQAEANWRLIEASERLLRAERDARVRVSLAQPSGEETPMAAAAGECTP